MDCKKALKSGTITSKNSILALTIAAVMLVGSIAIVTSSNPSSIGGQRRRPEQQRPITDAANRLLAASIQLKHANIDKGLLVDLNDSGYTFDEIADYLDRVEKN